MKNQIIFKTMLITLALSPFLINAAVFNRQLQIGMSGADVSTLQTFLAQDRTIYPQGLVTGYFGNLTWSAVSNFQARNNISPVGRVGPITLAFINNLMSGGVYPGTVNQALINTPSVSVSGSQAVVNWSTSIPTTASVYYSNSPISMTEQTDYSPFSINAPFMTVHSDMRSSHSAILTNLSANTTYYYVVYVRDSQGNENILVPITFTTSSGF